jgi:hypothetical protein
MEIELVITKPNLMLRTRKAYAREVRVDALLELGKRNEIFEILATKFRDLSWQATGPLYT